MTKNSFDNSSYLSQVRKSRVLAEKVLKQYPIKKYQLKFINHGENTTFKVTTNKEKYLLRIHRNGYHTKSALLEELKWLKSLSKKTDIPVQRPILSLNKKTLIKESTLDVESRFCDLLHWQEGHIKYKKNNQNFFDIGVLTAKLQKNSIATRHRNYWDTEGLIGLKATLGNLSAIKIEFPKEFKIIDPYRKEVYKIIKAYEKKNPKKLSLIHADLHFGNMLWNKGVIHPIDFDDCGYGLQIYDLAVTLYSSRNHFSRVGKKQALSDKDSLLKGYSSILDLTDQDIKILPWMILGREIAMIAWLYDRKDNQFLLKHLIKELPWKIKWIRSHLKKAEKGLIL